jgi:hypothetical protein
MSTGNHQGAALFAVAVALSCAGPSQGQERREQKPPVAGAFKSADAGSVTVTITGEGRGRDLPEAAAADKTYALAKNVEVVVGTSHVAGAGRGAGVLFKEVKLTEVAAGVRVSLALAADNKTVESIVAEGPIVRGRLKAVDAAKNSVTIQMPAQGGRGRGEAAAPPEETTYSLAPDADIGLDDGRGGRFSVKEGKPADLVPGVLVTVRLSVNLKHVQSLLAEGSSYQGTVKAIDAAKKTLTLEVRPPRGDDAGEEQVLLVSPEALVLLDDGKGRRLSLKEGKLADVPAGSVASVRLSADQSFAMQVRAEGPMLTGRLKGVDADKGIIVLSIPKGRNETDEKTLMLAKDARVSVDGAESTLANLKVGDDSPPIQLRLSLDQKTVQSIVARQAQTR